MEHRILRPRIEKTKTIDEAVEEIMKNPVQANLPRNPSAGEQGTILPASSAGITSNQEYWTIQGVNYRGQTSAYELSKSLLLNGEAHTQDEWAQHYIQAQTKDEFHCPDYPLLYAVIKAIYTTKDDSAKSEEVAQVQKFIKDNARARWLMTLTRIKYTPTGLDEIIHNYSTPDQYPISVDFITPNEWIKNTTKPKSYQALLDTSDSIPEINSVFQWLNGTDVYAWKVNEKPKKVVERVARLVADSGWVDLGCNGDPANGCASLGVRRARNFGGNK